MSEQSYGLDTFSFGTNILQLLATLAALYFVSSKLSANEMNTILEGVGVYVGIIIVGVLLLGLGVRAGVIRHTSTEEDS